MFKFILSSQKSQCMSGCRHRLSFEKSYFFSGGTFIFLTNNPNSDDDETVAEAATESGYIMLRPKGGSVAPAGELFRWWDVDLQLWDLAKANIHLDLSESIQLCSALTSCSLPPFAAFFQVYELIKLFFFRLLSLSSPIVSLTLSSRSVL